MTSTASSHSVNAPAHPPLSLDPSSLGSIPSLPLVPEAILRQHQAFIATDNRFRAAARLLQALWREDRDLPIGFHPVKEGNGHRLGSCIAVSAGITGANFIHPAIARLAKRELIYREAGAAYDEIRLLTNLLSSQPLVFNLFGPLKLDLARATIIFDAIMPGFMANVTEILFEHSPGRGDLHFSGDGTAFDILVRGHGPAGQRRFIAIEVKYSESGHEPVPRFSGRYDEIAPRSRLFVDASNPALRANPVQQLYRQMCLGHTMIETGLYDEGLHLFIAPALNTSAENAAASFIEHLASPQGGKLPFLAVTLEQFIATLADIGTTGHARALHRRYCDWWLIDGELQLEENSGCDGEGFMNPGIRSDGDAAMGLDKLHRAPLPRSNFAAP